MKPIEQGLLETSVPVQPAQQYNQVTVEDIARQMVAAGYDPDLNRLQAIADMKKVNLPQSVIAHALEIADSQVKQSKLPAAGQAPMTSTSGRTMQTIKPVNQVRPQQVKPFFR